MRVVAMACVFVHVASMTCLYSGSGAQESKYSCHDCRKFHGCLPFDYSRKAFLNLIKLGPLLSPIDDELGPERRGLHDLS